MNFKRNFPIWKILIGLIFVLILPSKSKAQVYELTCPVGTRALDSLTSYNNSTGKYRQNYCVDTNGNVSENLAALSVSLLTPFNCKKFEHVLCVDDSNTQGWAGTDQG